MSQLFDLLNGVAANAAKGVVNHAATAKAGSQEFAGKVYSALSADIASGKLFTQEQLKAISSTIHNVSQQSIGGIAASGKQAAVNGFNHVVDTPMGQLAGEASSAVMGSAPVKAMQNGASWAKGKGGSVLSDLDAFYHNADGSYDRTKVGVTAAAGLGIAGIAGYNMNN